MSSGPVFSNDAEDLPERGSAAPAPEGSAGIPAVGRQETRSLARVLTVVYALLITPVGLVLLGYGGGRTLQIVLRGGYEWGALLASGGTMIVTALLALTGGIVLLASVAATGVASSAGLLAAGLMGLPAVAASALTPLLMLIYDIFASVVPDLAMLDGLVYGHHLVVHPLLGGFGLSLLLARRRPAAPSALSLIGIVAIPLVLTVGALLMFQGHARGATMWARSFGTEIDPLALVLVPVGVLLLVLTVVATRWSPYALVIPALVLLALSATMLLPTSSLLSPSWLWGVAQGTVLTFLGTGGMAATGVLMLVHTGALALVRARSRRAQRHRTGPGAPGRPQLSDAG
ncbi:MAG TPA: hypothetical protein H9837_13100 [Candidatus Brachybacterium merdigallinarum]|nr:hypothetical protein [Candidatus Brachybacterium merdigallinarum]